ncbi:MAG: aminoglycoside phosphotransferase family protein [Defluviitaleaceae bacterium]|nr:aminoglycoside phosphotransferase family protein [Defluviitaleaceae bacterium]
MFDINASLVRKLIDTQFPEWRNLPIKPVKKSGHDNRTFHLGDKMTVRLPSHAAYAAAVEKEAKWLPVLAKHVSLPIPTPFAMGKPTDYYPLPWSVNSWLSGDTVEYSNIADLCEFAVDLASFLKELESVPVFGGTPAGVQNFHRGGDLSVYDLQTRESIKNVRDLWDEKLLTEIWELALSTKYKDKPVWVHGDVAIGNLLSQNGRLCGVIDFGTMGVGDPSSDLVIGWNFLDEKSRNVFFTAMGFDNDTINRARGWCLWKALITYDWNEKDSDLAIWGKKAVGEVVKEYRA